MRRGARDGGSSSRRSRKRPRRDGALDFLERESADPAVKGCGGEPDRKDQTRPVSLFSLLAGERRPTFLGTGARTADDGSLTSERLVRTRRPGIDSADARALSYRSPSIKTLFPRGIGTFQIFTSARRRLLASHLFSPRPPSASFVPFRDNLRADDGHRARAAIHREGGAAERVTRTDARQ